jgi:hypothetical protein
LLTIVMHYWTTGCIASSFVSYFDYAHNEPQPPIHVPVAVTPSREPSRAEFPRMLAGRVGSDFRFGAYPKQADISWPSSSRIRSGRTSSSQLSE